MNPTDDARKYPSESRSSSGNDDSDWLDDSKPAERRIGSRREIDIELTVYGRSACAATFYEPAKAIRGNANGGVLLLAIPVLEGQDLLLMNNSTSQEQICNVVSVRIDDIQISEVSVSFPVPNPDFWNCLQPAQNG